MTTDQIAAEAQTCCAHMKVVYQRINHEGGTCSDSWRCTHCGHKFIPEAWSKSAIEKAVARVDETWAGRFMLLSESRAAHASEQSATAEEIAKEFHCDCDVCTHSTLMCPASTSALILEIARLRQAQSDDTKRLELENEISNLKHDYEIVSSERNREKARMDELESRVYTNREGEHQLNIDFTLPTLRQAIDAAMSQ